MKRFCKFALLIILVPLCAGAGIGYDAKIKKIVASRIREVITDTDTRIENSKSEYDALRKRYLNTLIAQRKMQLLSHSSQFMKQECPPFDLECRRIYDMTIVYLRDEAIKSAQRLATEHETLDNSLTRLHYYKKKKGQLELTDAPEIESAVINAPIPALKNLFTCNKVESWNLARGVFLAASNTFDLPVETEITEVTTLRSASFIAAKTEDGTVLNFAYTGRPLVKPGQKAPPYTKLFEGASGNPADNASAILILLKHGKPVDSTFMCK